MLFGGFLININYLPLTLRLAQYISPYRYTLEALLVNEMHGRIILFNPPGSISVQVKAELILEFFGFSTKHLALNLGCLSGIALLSVAFAAILLNYCVREKR
jgi:ATP-binding cassette subfamily G (WHITE) protein 2